MNTLIQLLTAYWPELLGLLLIVALIVLFVWVRRRQTRHPAQPYQATLDFDPVRVAAVPRTFVNCTEPPLATIDVIRTRVVDPKFWSGAWLPGSRVVTLTTGHDPMISAPAELTQILLDCALA